jgi:hypothetical protein
MKQMKKLIPIIAAFFVLILSSCEVEDIDLPDADPRDSFTGTWNCTDTQLKATNESYTVTISYDPSNSGQVLLSNFGLLGNSAQPYAYVTGSLITIPEQQLSNGYTVSGSGSLVNSDQIDWTYTTNDGADAFSYEATFTR